MGNAKTNLEYLKTTKSLIKQAIIDKGVEVSDTDTFRSYKDKIAGISGGGTIHNCTLNGSVFNLNGYITNFSGSNYISGYYDTNAEEAILRIKYLANGGITSTLQCLCEITNVVNIQFSNSQINCWSWKDNKSYTTSYSFDKGETLYVSVYFTDQDTSAGTCKRKLYISKTGFSIEASDLKMTLTDNISSGGNSYMGALKSTSSSTSETRPMNGFIDLSETCVIKPDGTYITRYYY